MAPLTRLALLLLLVTLVARPSFAGPKFDLSSYLSGPGLRGDFKVFERSTGGTRTLTLLRIEPWKKTGWMEEVLSEVEGAGEPFDGSMIGEDFVIPGKQSFSGSEFYDDGLILFARKPAKGLKFQTVPGKPQRFSQKTLVVFDGFAVGKVQRQGTWTMSPDGLESVATPNGRFDDAVRARASSISRMSLIRGAAGCSQGVCGRHLVQDTNRTLWYAAGVGLVRAEIDLRFFVDGRLVDEFSWVEELVSGSIGGEPIP